MSHGGRVTFYFTAAPVGEVFAQFEQQYGVSIEYRRMTPHYLHRQFQN